MRGTFGHVEENERGLIPFSPIPPTTVHTSIDMVHHDCSYPTEVCMVDATTATIAMKHYTVYPAS